MTEARIDRALESAAAAALGSDFTGRIATEGNPFTPPAAGAWAQLTNLRAGADVASLGVGGMDDHTGVFQIDITVPANSANPRGVLLGHADRLRAFFVAGRPLTFQGQTVRVRSASVSSLRLVDTNQRVSVSISYTALTIRPEIT